MGLFSKKTKSIDEKVSLELRCGGRVVNKRELKVILRYQELLSRNEVSSRRFVKMLSQYTFPSEEGEHIMDFRTEENLYAFLEECRKWLCMEGYA